MNRRAGWILGLTLAVPGIAVAQAMQDDAFLTDLQCGDGSVARVWEVAEGLQIVVDGRGLLVLPRIRPDVTGDVLFAGHGLAWGWSQDHQGLLYRLSAGEDPVSATPVVCRPEEVVSPLIDPLLWVAHCADGRRLSLSFYADSGLLDIGDVSWSVFATDGEPEGEEHWRGEGLTLIWRDGGREAELIEGTGSARRSTHCAVPSP